jgi:polysaccharide biosynthesis protein PslH
MKILYLTTVLPSSKKTGGEIASQSFIDALEQSGHSVRVAGYYRLNDVNTKKANEVVIGARSIETNKSFLSALMWMVRSLLKNLPYSAAKYYSSDYVRTVNRLVDRDNYDIIIIDHAQIEWIANLLTRDSYTKKSQIVFIAHNIEHEVYFAQSRSARSFVSKLIYWREARLIRQSEVKLARIANQVWTFTPHDLNYFRPLNKNSLVFDLPSSLTLSSKPLQYQNHNKFDIGIIGSWTWKANLLGLKWFFETVYPYLPKHISIHVAGKGAEWLRNEYKNVEYCGFVPDVQEFMAQSKVIAIPSITGGGVQIKTLDAIASGLPIVATPTALRGILSYPSFVKVALTPSEFAYTLVDLIEVCNLNEDTYYKLFDERLQWLELRRHKFLRTITNALDNQ